MVKKVLKMKMVGKSYYKQPEEDIVVEKLSIRETEYENAPAFAVDYDGQRIGSVALNLNNYEKDEGYANKNALHNAISYEIVKYKDHSWGGYMVVEVTLPEIKRPETKREKQLKIARDWGAFMELRKDDKLPLNQDAYWIIKICEHNPIKEEIRVNSMTIQDLLCDDYQYEDVDNFIANFSTMHKEVYKIIGE